MVQFIRVANRSTRRKPPRCRQSLTNFSVTNNLIQNIAVIPDIMFKFLTVDTDGQHSTWRYDKKDDCSFTNTHFPQNSIIPTARVWILIFTTLPLHSNLQFIFRIAQRHRILRTKLLNQDCLRNRLILSFDHLVLNVRRPSPEDLV